MLDLLRLFLHVLAAPLRTQAQLEAEVTLLRHQLNVLRRQAPSKPRLTAADRLLLVWLWRLVPSLRSAITIVQPDTVLRWHRSGFRLYWRWKSRSRTKDAPLSRPVHRFGDVIAKPILGGLHHEYCRI
jgi:hypothetical protein